MPPGELVVSIMVLDDVEFHDYSAQEARTLGEHLLEAAAWVEALEVQA